MRTRTLLHGLCSAAVVLHCSPAAQAQVFIPSTLERDWLNAEIPGIVDAGGIMDTLHPAIAELDSAWFYIPGEGAVVDMVGVQYLDSLARLSINGSAALSVANFPARIEELQIYNYNGSITLGGLPAVLDHLFVFSNGGQATLDIIAMPDTTRDLFLSNLGAITCGPPGYVEQLHVSGEQLGNDTVVLPGFVAGTLTLSSMGVFLDLSAVTANVVFFNQPGALLAWPSGVTVISFSFFMTPIPPWPITLESLNIDPTPTDICFPPFPDGLSYFNVHLIPDCIPNWPMALDHISALDGDYTQGMVNYCSVLNSSCPGANSGIAGRVFADIDADGQHDAGEPGLPQTQIILQPGGQGTGCGADGTWDIGVLPGAYTITAASNYPYIQGIAPATHGASVPNMGDTDVDNEFAVTLTPDIQDLRVSLYADPARPGFDNRLYLTCQNYGTMPVDAELTLGYNGDQSWVGSSLVPTSTTGTTATWSLPAMAIGASTTITVDLTTAASVALGTDIVHTLAAAPIATDETPANNTTQYTDSVVGSYDPNDKLLHPAVLSPAQVQAEEKAIEYTIRFQNTGTYLAERVVILDTLSADLQWASMQFIASSHPCQWYITDGVLHVIHNDINLPDSTSDEPNSHGFVKFSMLPSADLQDGAEIVNIAHIVFDFNVPIITPPAIFRVDVLAGVEERTPGTVAVYPNPARELLCVGAPGTTRGVTTYAVHDILGKQLLQGTLDQAAQIAIGGLANGVYNLTIHDLGQQHVTRFVKE